MNTSKRLSSLDILRGMDLFLLLFLGPVFYSLLGASQSPALDFLRIQTEHVEWDGFVLWDIIMPLFIFMSGVTVPFSNTKYEDASKRGEFIRRIIKRLVLLFFLGWIVQGNLLMLDFKQFHPYANTLQTIAVGYAATAVITLYLGRRWQIAAFAVIFAIYLLAFVIPGGMDFGKETNIAMVIDEAVLGSHRDGVIWAADGSWSYNPDYQYTWILSSLSFICTAMLGGFAGQMIRSSMGKERKALMLLLTGVALVAAALAMSPAVPIIKKIWSSSMMLLAGGISFIALSAVYYAVDVRGWSKGLGWLKWWGMNSIAAYCIGEVISFSSVSRSLLYGFEQYLGAYYPLLISLANGLILMAVLAHLYRRGIFLKV